MSHWELDNTSYLSFCLFALTPCLLMSPPAVPSVFYPLKIIKEIRWEKPGTPHQPKNSIRRAQYCDTASCVKQKLTRSIPNATSLVAVAWNQRFQKVASFNSNCNQLGCKSWLVRWLHLGLKKATLKPLVSSESGFLQPCWLHLGLSEATLKPFETTGFIWAWFHATLLVAFWIERVNFG